MSGGSARATAEPVTAGAGRLTWREPDALAVSVHRSGTGWGVTASWPGGHGAGAARDTRDEALACVPEVVALAREGEARRVRRTWR